MGNRVSCKRQFIVIERLMDFSVWMFGYQDLKCIFFASLPHSRYSCITSRFGDDDMRIDFIHCGQTYMFSITNKNIPSVVLAVRTGVVLFL